MNYLTVEAVSKSYGERTLFEDLTFYINQGDRVAFIAKNGTGKTSLMNIIMNREEGDAGKVWLHHKINVGYLDQNPQFDPKATVFESVYNSPNPIMQAIVAYETCMAQPDDAEAMQTAISGMDRLQAWDYEVKIKQILSQLKVDYLDRPIAQLSGGQKKRVALAKVLIDAPDFLILDEPTNHLDLDMIEWLEAYLKQGGQTIFMVTHDRYFLDSVCTQILELDQQKIHKYNGSYAYYIEKKAEREASFNATTEKAKNLYIKELDWMRRQPKARGTKAKARIDKFFEVEKKAKRKVDSDRVHLDIKMTRLGSKIIEFHKVHKAYGPLQILDGFDYKFSRKDRVGIVGNNGTGKTTLLNILVGTESVDAGKVIRGDTVVVGYYTQKGINLKDDQRVIDVVRDIAEFIPMHGGQKLSAVQLCERFLFDAKKQQNYLSKLSGGERRRLYLLTILMKNPNFLILDEPTNDLDIVTLQVLEEFLLDFPGVIVIVSHDRHFMDKIVEHTFVLEGNGQLRDFPGNYSAYRTFAKEQAQSQKKEIQIQQKQTEPAKSKSKISHEEQKEFKRLERQIAKLEDQKTSITQQFNQAGLSPESIQELSKELNEVAALLEEKENRWMELVDAYG